MKIVEALAFIALVGCALFLVAFIAFTGAGDVAKARDHRAEREAYVKKNCKHVGYYGRSGERKTYDCLGKIMREGDLY